MAKATKYRHRARIDVIEPIPQTDNGPGFWGWAAIIFFAVILLAQCTA